MPAQEPPLHPWVRVSRDLVYVLSERVYLETLAFRATSASSRALLTGAYEPSLGNLRLHRARRTSLRSFERFGVFTWFFERNRISDLHIIANNRPPTVKSSLDFGLFQRPIKSFGTIWLSLVNLEHFFAMLLNKIYNAVTI